MARRHGGSGTSYITSSVSIPGIGFPFFMSCWFRSNLITTRTIMSTWASGIGDEYEIGINSDGTAFARTTAGFVSSSATSTSTYSTNTWTHLAGVWNAAMRIVYLNGSQVTDSTIVPSTFPNTVRLFNNQSVDLSFQRGIIGDAFIANYLPNIFDILSLRDGASPLLLPNKSKLRTYLKLQDQNNDYDFITGQNYTVTGTILFGNHYERMRYPDSVMTIQG